MKITSYWLSRSPLVLLAILLLCLLGYRSGLLPLSILVWGFAVPLLVLLLIGVIAVGTLLIAIFRRKRSLAIHSGIALMLAAIPCLVIGVTVGAAGFSAPPIHDITTDTINPPVYQAAVAERSEKENSLDYAGAELAAMQQAAYPHIVPLQSPLAAKITFDAAAVIVQQLGWRLIRANEQALEIEAVEETLILGFKDDVIIRITPQAVGSRVDVRSVSRIGMGDLGANAKRVQRFLTALDEKLAAEVER